MSAELQVSAGGGTRGSRRDENGALEMSLVVGRDG